MIEQHLRQGDTTTILITFDQSIGQNDIKVGIYDPSDKEVFTATLSEGGITFLGENSYRVIIEHSTTVKFVGRYYMDVLLKSPTDTSYVNTGETPINLLFKKASISKNLQ